MAKHAVLSPSKSSMWLNCTPSAKLSEGYKTTSEAADEGSLAHELSELLLKKVLKKVSEKDFLVKVKSIKANKHYNASMMEHCVQFSVYVIEQYTALQQKFDDAAIFLEVKLDLRHYIPEGFGTGDIILVAGDTIQIIDLKYGKGVFVKAKGNTQMKIYGLGALEAFSIFSNEYKKVNMTIYQPRLGNIDSWKITTKELTKWATETLAPKAKLAYNGKGERVAGEHCKFCPVKATCKAHADYNMTIAGVEFDDLPEKAGSLTDKQLAEVYAKAKQIRNWLTGIEEYMLAKAIAGKTWKGLKLVYGRSTRVISNPDAIIKILKAKKVPVSKFLSEPQLLGITALEKNIGAEQFQKLTSKYITKSLGKPSLVSAESKGKEYNVNESAKEDFS